MAQNNLPPLSPLPPETGSSTNKPPVTSGAQPASELENLRLSLRSALSEAAQQTSASRMQQLSGLVGGGAAPSVINAAIGLAQQGLATSQESVFGDVIDAYKETSALKQKELDRINELRLEFGSAIPANVTSLATALDLATPLIDQERDLDRRQKLASLANSLKSGQTDDEDVETAAEFVAGGGSLAQVGGSAAYKAKVRIRAEEIKKGNEETAKQQYKDAIALRLNNSKVTMATYDSERGRIFEDESLTAVDRREALDYIDGLENTQKETAQQNNNYGYSVTRTAVDNLNRLKNVGKFLIDGYSVTRANVGKFLSR